MLIHGINKHEDPRPSKKENLWLKDLIKIILIIRRLDFTYK